jgi:TatA/E family protein of Tat protein translocase
MNALLFLETVGTSELLLVAVAALLLFGPRKLPEISRTLGKAMAEFKRASDDFKRTWEYEVELERRKPALDAAEQPRQAAGESSEQTAGANAPGASAWGASASGVTAEELMSRAVRSQEEGRTVARNAPGAEAWTGGGANENGGAGETEQDEIELNAS